MKARKIAIEQKGIIFSKTVYSNYLTISKKSNDINKSFEIYHFCTEKISTPSGLTKYDPV